MDIGKDIATLGINLVLTGQEAVTSGLEKVGVSGAQAAERVEGAFRASGESLQRVMQSQVADAQRMQESVGRSQQVLETQLATLTQITQGWASSGAEARDIATQLAASIASSGRMAQASAEQMRALSDAQAVIAGTSTGVAESTSRVTDATRAMTLAQIEATHINEGLTASAGSVIDVNRRMSLLQIQAAQEDDKRTESARRLIAVEQQAYAEEERRQSALRAGVAVEQQAYAQEERRQAVLRQLASSEAAAYTEEERRSASIRKMALLQSEAIAMDEARNRSASGGVSKFASLTAAYDNSTGGIGRLRQGMVSLVSQMTGTNAVVDRTVTTLGGFALGNTLVLGIVAGVAAIGYAYEKLTASAHEAAKAAEEFAKTQEGRIASATNLGVVASARISAGSSLPAGGLDIPALSDEAKKAGDAVRGLQNDLKGLDVGGGAGGTIAGGPTKDVRDLIHQLELGQVDATGLATALSNMSHGAAFFDPLISKVADFGGRLIAAQEQYAKLTNTIQQATAQQNYYTLSLSASSVDEGKLLEKIAERQLVLGAIQSGGVVAGNRASDQNAALEIAQKLYEGAATSGKHAELATVAFQDALKNTASVAHGFAEQFLQDGQRSVGVERAISDAQKQQTTGLSDATRFTALADSIHRLEQESKAFGKDQSIDTKIAGLDDQISHFVEGLQQQVATGKLSQASFEAQAASAEGLRQALYAAGAAMREAYNEQVTKQITDQYNASKQLYEAVIDGAGSYHELTAAKAAQLEIAARERASGQALSEVQKQLIIDQKNYDAAIEASKGTQTIEQHAAAVRAEVDAIKSGESTRATYASDLKYRTELAAAALITDQKIHDARVKAIEDDHNASVALDTLKASLASQTTEAQRFERELQSINKALEQDLLHGIEQFATKGVTSFRSLFQEVEQLSLRMVGQLDSAIKKLSEEWANVFSVGGDTSKLDDELRKLEQLRHAAGLVGTVTTAGTVGYNFGQQAQTTGNGIVGGAVTGAAAGFELLGPTGAVVGGLVGAAAGLLGAADAHKAAAHAIEEASKAIEHSLAGYGNTNSVQTSLIQNDTSYDAIKNAILTNVGAALKNGANAGETFAKANDELTRLEQDRKDNAARIVKDFWDSITQDINNTRGAAGQYRNALAAINKAHDDNIAGVNALAAANVISGVAASAARDQIDALAEAQRKAAQAAYDEGLRQQKLSLDAREANAKGETAIGELLTRRAQEDAERFKAEQEGWSDADKARLVYIQGLEDEATALAKRNDAQQTLAQANASGPTGTLQSKQAADLSPLLTQQTKDQTNYDALAKQLDDDTKKYNADLAAQADATTLAADQAAIAADNYSLLTQSVTLAGDKAAIAAKKWADAIALVAAAVSDIQRDIALGFTPNSATNPAGITAEQNALGFGGLSIDQIKALYTPYTGTPLTNEQEQTDKAIQQFLQDYDKVFGTVNGVAQAVTDAVTAAGKTGAVSTGNPATEVVTYAAKNLTEATGNRMSEYLASILVVEREQLKALTGGIVHIPDSTVVHTSNTTVNNTATAIDHGDTTSIVNAINNAVTNAVTNAITHTASSVSTSDTQNVLTNHLTQNTTTIGGATSAVHTISTTDARQFVDDHRDQSTAQALTQHVAGDTFNNTVSHLTSPVGSLDAFARMNTTLDAIRDIERKTLEFFNGLSATPLPESSPTAPLPVPSYTSPALGQPRQSSAGPAQRSGPVSLTIAPTVNIHLDKDASADEKAFAHRIVGLVVKEVDEKLAEAYAEQQLLSGNTRVEGV